MQRDSLARLALLALLGLSACDRFTKAEPEPRPKKAASSKTLSNAKPKPAPPAPPLEPGQRYLVPFAWESSRDEPLSQARAYVKEILTDNRVYMQHGPRFFATLAAGQKPRATVITCADSRVHTPAFDTTPENDSFLVRNIGNQVRNAEGSVEYGVEHLATPVLLVLGHTGCGAVQAALSDTSGLSEPIRNELEKLELPKPNFGTSADAALRDGVIANVHNQVSFALTRFGARVREGKLTVIGAVYDLRNDLGNGPGKLTIIDVNGNSEPERMRAFTTAIESEMLPTKRKEKESPRGTQKAGSIAEPTVNDSFAHVLDRIAGLNEHRATASNPASP